MTGKYIQLILDSSKFFPSNIPTEYNLYKLYINYSIDVEKKFRKLFNNLYDDNKISKDEFLRIYLVGSRPGFLYAIKKFYELVVNNMPKFRPISSAINTTGYNLTKYLILILKPLTQRIYC